MHCGSYRRAAWGGVLLAATLACGGGGGSAKDPAPAAAVQGPLITRDVQDATAAPGATATFQVAATGADHYQWYRDGVALAGATASTYTTPVLGDADDGRKYKVDLSNATATVTSREAVLRVSSTGTGAVPGSDVGNAAYDIPATDVQGNPRRLSELRGKVVVVSFSAMWCRPCQAESPELEKLYQKYRAQGLEVFQVVIETEGHGAPAPADLQRWIDTIKGQSGTTLDFQVVAPDPAAQADRLYKVQYLPTTLVLDRDQVIRFRGLFGDTSKLDGVVSGLLAR